MARGVWTEKTREDAKQVRDRLSQGSASRVVLAQTVRDPIDLALALGLLREEGAIACDPPFDRAERGAPRRYWLKEGAHAG